MTLATMEPLEGRRLLAADPFATAAPDATAPHVGRSGGTITALPDAGMGLGSMNYYQTSWAFANAFKTASGPVNGAGRDGLWRTTDGSPLPSMNANGYPTQALGSNVDLETYVYRDISGHYPAGNWVLQWDGSGEMEVRHDGKTQDVTRKDTDGRLNVDVVEGQQHRGFQVRIKQTDPNDPVRNVRLWMPGHEGQQFHDTFERRLEPFGVLRMMDWGDTNESPVTSWGQRTQVADASYAVLDQRDAPQGVPYEEMIRLANATGKDLWITVPHRVVDGDLNTADDFVQKLGRLVRYGGRANGEPSNANGDGRVNPPLRGDLNLWIEYSNETWNTGFGVYVDDQPRVEGQTSYVQLKGDQWGVNRARAHGRLSRDVFETIEEAMGGRGRLVRVVSGHAANAWVLDQAAMSLPAAGTKGAADAFAITHYYGGARLADGKKSQEWLNDRLDPNNPNDLPTASEKTQFFDRLRQHVDDAAVKWGQNAGHAADYGVPMVSYEGNQHHDALGVRGNVRHPNLTTALHQLSRDGRQAGVYEYALDKYRDAGGRMPTAFVDTSRWATSGQWGHLEYQDQPTNQATLYKALTDWVADNPDQGGGGGGFGDGDTIRLESVRYDNRWLDGDDKGGGTYGVDTRSNTTSSDTLWKVRDAGDGWFHLANQRYYNVLDADGDWATPAWNVDLNGDRSKDDTRWRFEAVPGQADVYRLVDKRYGRYLDADGSNKGWNVDTGSGKDGTDKQWRVAFEGGGSNVAFAAVPQPATATPRGSIFSNAPLAASVEEDAVLFA